MEKYKVKIFITCDLNDRYQMVPIRKFFEENLCEFTIGPFEYYNRDYVIDCILTEEQISKIPTSPYISVIKQEYKTVNGEWDLYDEYMKKVI